MNLILALKYLKALIAFALSHILEMTIVVLTVALIVAISLWSNKAKEADYLRAEVEHVKTECALTLTTERANFAERARKLERESYDQTIQAINDHKKREAINASAIADASTANERLSQTIDRLAANAATDADFRVKYAATSGELLKECGSSITELAKAADGHVNDIRLLQQAR